jgi:hypothetical protein
LGIYGYRYVCEVYSIIIGVDEHDIDNDGVCRHFSVFRSLVPRRYLAVDDVCLLLTCEDRASTTSTSYPCGVDCVLLSNGVSCGEKCDVADLYGDNGDGMCVLLPCVEREPVGGTSTPCGDDCVMVEEGCDYLPCESLVCVYSYIYTFVLCLIFLFLCILVMSECLRVRYLMCFLVTKH